MLFLNRSASATRPSAGTPQFQNLSGAVRTVTSSVTSSGVSSNSSNNSNRSVTNLNGNVAPSPAYVSVSVMPRSVSGHNLNQVKKWDSLKYCYSPLFIFLVQLFLDKLSFHKVTTLSQKKRDIVFCEISTKLNKTNQKIHICTTICFSILIKVYQLEVNIFM